MIGRRMSVQEVLAEGLKDRLFYDQSGGGVTFSGGEPLMQPGFLKEALEACKSEGLRTAVDTCGYASPEHIMSIAAHTDLFLYDLKFIDSDKHLWYTGVSNALILKNFILLARSHGNIWLRIPVIPGLNDDDEHLAEVSRLVKTTGGVRRVNVLPYHRTGVEKFRRLEKFYRLEQTPNPTIEDLERLKKRIAAFGLEVTLGG